MFPIDLTKRNIGIKVCLIYLQVKHIVLQKLSSQHVNARLPIAIIHHQPVDQHDLEKKIKIIVKMGEHEVVDFPKI